MDSVIAIPFNELIKHRVLQPEALLKWLSHSSVKLLIGRVGKGEGGGGCGGGGRKLA